MTLLHTTHKMLLNNAMLKAVGAHEKWSRCKKNLKMVRILKQPFRLNTNVRVAMFCAMHKFSRGNSGTIINAKWLQRNNRHASRRPEKDKRFINICH